MRWCPECKERSAKFEVCTNCGLVFEDKPIDYRPSRRDLDNPETKTHNMETSQFLKNLKTQTRINLREVKNSDLKRAMKKFYYNWREKRGYEIKKEMKRICSLLGLTKDFYASCIYSYFKICKFNEKADVNIFRGGGKVSLEVIAQGIIYLEIKKQQLPFTLYDFEKIECETKKVSDYYTRLIKEMNIKIKQIHPRIFIERIIGTLEITIREKSFLTLCSKTFLENIMEIEEESNSITRFRNPIITAAVCVYLLSNKIFKITQKKICEIAGCDIRTLRKRINEIKETIQSNIQLFGYGEEDFEKALEWDMFSPFVNNMKENCEFDELLIKGLIHPEYRMELLKTKEKFKAVFYDTTEKH